MLMTRRWGIEVVVTECGRFRLNTVVGFSKLRDLYHRFFSLQAAHHTILPAIAYAC